MMVNLNLISKNTSECYIKEKLKPCASLCRFRRRRIHVYKDLMDFLLRAFVKAEAKNSGEPLNFLK